MSVITRVGSIRRCSFSWYSTMCSTVSAEIPRRRATSSAVLPMSDRSTSCLGGDPQAAGHVLGRAADERPEHELLEAKGVGRILPLEGWDDVLAVVAACTAMEG